MLKIWKLTLWKVSSVNDTLGHTLLCKCLSTKVFWERESLRLVPWDSNLVNATNNFNVLVLFIWLRNNFRLANANFFNWSLWISHRTLVTSLSSNFLFKDIKRGRGKSRWNPWHSVAFGRTDVLKQVDAPLWHSSRVSSKNVVNRLLYGGFTFSFENFIIFLNFHYDQIVC